MLLILYTGCVVKNCAAVKRSCLVHCNGILLPALVNLYYSQ